MKRHSSKRQRYEPWSEKTWSTLRWLQRYDELRRSIEMICIITKNVGLLPWVVCVSGISRYFDDGSWTSVAAFLLLRHALMKYSEVELWTAEMSFQYNVRLMNNIHLWIFCFRMKTFIKTFILFTKRDVIASTITDGTFFSSSIHHIPHLQPGQRSLFGGTTKTSTSRLQLKLWIVIDNISSHFREAV